MDGVRVYEEKAPDLEYWTQERVDNTGVKWWQSWSFSDVNTGHQHLEIKASDEEEEEVEPMTCWTLGHYVELCVVAPVTSTTTVVSSRPVPLTSAVTSVLEALTLPDITASTMWRSEA